MKIDLQTVIKKNTELLETDIDGEKVMMSLESGNYYGLDMIATRIWQLVEKPIKLGELINILLEEYDINREKCTQDVIEFLNHLENNRLLIINPS